MKVIIEDEDWIEAVKPFYNGCAYRLIFKADGSVWIDYGCYHLVRLQTGFKEYLQSIIPEKGGLKIECSPELKAELLKSPRCDSCGYPLHEPRK